MSGRHFLTAFRQLASWSCSAALSSTAQVRFLRLSSSSSSSSSSVYTPTYSRLTHGRLLHNNRHRSYSTAATATSATIPDHDHDLSIGARTQHKKERVLLLMSGGVDSSMCAHILHNQGYAVTGLYMHNWNHDEETQDEVEALSSPSSSSSSSSSQNSAYLSQSTLSTDHQQPSGGNGYKPIPRTAPIRPKACTSDRDWADVQSICAQIGIPARRLDFSRQYWNQVFQVMLQEYERGRTPNPDVSCNREIKFGELIEWCWRNGGLGKDRGGEEGEGWDYLATGHYARVERDPQTGVARLLRAKDSNKDQTYYLSTLSERVLRHVLFPLAQYDKPTVKRMALSFASSSSTANQDDELTSLQNAALKKESMGICFVGQRRRFGDFLKEYLDPLPGPVRINGLGGEVIGMHKGLFQYTVGQASGVTHKHNKWVVLRTDLPSNTLIVVDGTQNDRLFSPGLIAEDWHWISGAPPKKLLRFLSSSSSSPSTTTTTTTTNQDEQQDEYPFTAQIRHRQVPQPCAIEPISDSMAAAAALGDQVSSTITTNEEISSARLFRVKFKDFQRAIAPGQILVLYDKDECLGGAVIKSSLVRPEYAHEDSGTQSSSTTN